MPYWTRTIYLDSTDFTIRTIHFAREATESGLHICKTQGVGVYSLWKCRPLGADWWVHGTDLSALSTIPRYRVLRIPQMFNPTWRSYMCHPCDYAYQVFKSPLWSKKLESDKPECMHIRVERNSRSSDITVVMNFEKWFPVVRRYWKKNNRKVQKLPHLIHI